MRPKGSVKFDALIDSTVLSYINNLVLYWWTIKRGIYNTPMFFPTEKCLLSVGNIYVHFSTTFFFSQISQKLAIEKEIATFIYQNYVWIGVIHLNKRDENSTCFSRHISNTSCQGRWFWKELIKLFSNTPRFIFLPVQGSWQNGENTFYK